MKEYIKNLYIRKETKKMENTTNAVVNEVATVAEDVVVNTVEKVGLSTVLTAGCTALGAGTVVYLAIKGAKKLYNVVTNMSKSKKAVVEDYEAEDADFEDAECVEETEEN